VSRRPAGARPEAVRSPAPEISRLVSPLLVWFCANARDLPWRRTRDPYAIWVAEIMLQQTQVSTVLPYWERWLQALPTVATLASAPADRVLKLWEGLGYYRRARHLQEAAALIMKQHDGRVPNDFDALLALPGIGRYTAGAIASIAFNQPRPVLDGNVIRVLTRVFGLRDNPRLRRTNDRLWQLAGALVETSQHAPGSNPCSALNQGLMELGALVCTPHSPDCPACPWQRRCVARREGLTDQLPNLGPRPVTTTRHFHVLVVQRADALLVRRRPGNVLNAHLWEFPNCEVNGAAPLRPETSARALLNTRPDSCRRLGVVKGTVTRFRLSLEVFLVTLPAGARVSRRAGQWKYRRELDALAFSSTHRRILRLLEPATDG
jgi:A/G-specific adenine glycosylase